MLLVGALERVNVLFVFAGAERGDNKGLSLAAREQRRTMRARQNTHFRSNGANGLGIAAVDPASTVEHGVAHDICFDIVEQVSELVLRKLPLTFTNKLLRGASPNFGNTVATRVLFRNLECAC